MRSLLLLSLAAVLGWVTPPARPLHRLVASVDTVDLTPALDTLFDKQPFSLTARVVDSVGRTKNTRVTWIVRDSSLFRNLKTSGTYSTKFKAFAKGDSGRTYVVASAGTKKDSSLIIVRDTVCDESVLASINLVPDSTTAHRTDTLGFGMAPRNQCGGYMNGVNPTFSAGGSGLTVSRVDSLWARAIATDSSGTAYVKAVSGSIRDSVKVKLKPAP